MIQRRFAGFLSIGFTGLTFIAGSNGASAHTMMHMGLYDVERSIKLTPTMAYTRYECTLTSTPAQSPLKHLVDTNADDQITSEEKQILNQGSAAYLAGDLIIFLDKDMLPSTTKFLSMYPDEAGFSLEMETLLPKTSGERTTEVITLIDPAFLFPPPDVALMTKPTSITAENSVLVSEDHTTATKLSVPSIPATPITWRRFK